MADFDAFNGDADGLCALLQLRRAEPRASTLVTGVKRDIQLLARVDAGPGDRVTALDISLDSNRKHLQRILTAGAEVYYCDHHFAGDIPAHAGLTAHINTAAETCTSLIVNGLLGGRFSGWAVVGAYGDNLDRPAETLARARGLEDHLQVLRQLGVCINYNAYGASLEDLNITPQALYARLAPHDSPLQFLAEDRPLFEQLSSAYATDLDRARGAATLHESATVAVLVLPEAAWARRVSGVYGNLLANEHPDRAHAVLTEKSEGGFLVSVRAPLAARSGADEVCRQFDTGGGRAAAAGINHLPQSDLDRFLAALLTRYPD